MLAKWSFGNAVNMQPEFSLGQGARATVPIAASAYARASVTRKQPRGGVARSPGGGAGAIAPYGHGI